MGEFILNFTSFSDSFWKPDVVEIIENDTSGIEDILNFLVNEGV